MIVVTISGKPVDRNPPKPKTRVIWNEDEAIPTEKPVQEPRGGAVPGGLKRVEDSLWQEINAIKAERETLSSSIAPLVARFQREGKIVGTQILDPEAKAQLSKLYDQIDALTKEASAVYRSIDNNERHSEQSEESSDKKQDYSSGENIASLKLLKRSLQNRRHKLRKKIEAAQAKLKVKSAGGMSSPGGGARRAEGGSTKLQQWILQLADLDTQEQSVNEKLENL